MVKPKERTNPSEAYKQFVIQSFNRSIESLGQTIDELLQEVRRLRQENKRYREALEKIKYEGELIQPQTGRISYTRPANIARKALEGEE